MSVGSVGLSGDFFGAFIGDESRPANLDRLVRRMERGEFDLIGVGRALITDPEWAAKVRGGRMDEMRGFTTAALSDFT